VGSNPTSSASATCEFDEVRDGWSALGPLPVRQSGRSDLLQAVGQGRQLGGEQVPVGVQGDVGGCVAELRLHGLDAGAWAISSDAQVCRRSSSRSPSGTPTQRRGEHRRIGRFRRAYRESPYGYLMTRRIERAMALLCRGDRSVTDVCFAVGCSSLGSFSSRFTELVGVPPSVYRRQAARATAGMPSCVAKQVTRPVRNREASAASRT
jgi:Helix-turn-helix domain